MQLQSPKRATFDAVAQLAAPSATDLNLIEAQHVRAIIDVVIDGMVGHFQSVILRVDPLSGSILIDELFPLGAVLLPAQPLTISVRQADGSRIGFATQIIERRHSAGVDNYLLRLPASVAYRQRREVFRLRLARNRPLASEFQTADRQFCAAVVQDLSASGIRLELQNAIPLAKGDMLTALDFEFERQHFQCQACVRHVYYDRSGKTIIGAAFSHFPRTQQRQLERIIMQQQQQQQQQRSAARQLRAEQAELPLRGGANG